MQNKIKLIGTFILSVSLFSCAVKYSSNSGIAGQGSLNAIVGGETDVQAHASGHSEGLSFDEIAKHMAFVMIDKTDSNGNVQYIESASAVIVSEKFIITSAHLFEGHVGTDDHLGTIYFGNDGPLNTRISQEFSKGDILNKTPAEIEDLSTKGWSARPGNKDYVLIRLRNGVPPGYKQIQMINDLSFFKEGATYRLAGFGRSENNNNDHLLRLLSLTLSRSDFSQHTDIYSPPSALLGVEDKKYFLELEGSDSASVRPGDSGGPIFYQGVDASGNPIAFLAGITTAYKNYQHTTNCTNKLSICGTAEYGLRVDAFSKDVVDTATRIYRGL